MFEIRAFQAANHDNALEEQMIAIFQSRIAVRLPWFKAISLKSLNATGTDNGRQGPPNFRVLETDKTTMRDL